MSPQGTYLYEVSPSGSAKELPAGISDSDAGLAGIAPAGPDSIWVQIETATTDRQEGVWVGTGPQVFHVSATGAVSRLRPSLVRPGNYAGVTSMAMDRRGNLWLAVVRGYEQLTTEVIEYSPKGQVRTFKVGRRFFPTESIGVSAGRPVIRSGRDPCHAGPSTCIIDTPGTIVVGQITGTNGAS